MEGMKREFTQRIRHLEGVYQTKMKEQKDELEEEFEAERNCKICVREPVTAVLTCGHAF